MINDANLTQKILEDSSVGECTNSPNDIEGVIGFGLEKHTIPQTQFLKSARTITIITAQTVYNSGKTSTNVASI